MCLVMTCHAMVGCRVAWSALTGPFLILVYTNGHRNHSCGSASSFQSGGEFTRQEENSLVGEP